MVGGMLCKSDKPSIIIIIKEASRKLMPKWIGPFCISKLMGSAAVKLDLPPKWAIHPVFHISLIKPYLSNGSVQSPPSMDYIDDEPIFQVDCLLDKILSKKRQS